MRRTLWILSLVCLAPPALAQDLFLTGGHLVNPATRTIERANLLIEDGEIAGRPAKAPEGFAGATLDVTGKWVIPGLHDLHTHSYGNQAPGGQFEFLGAPGTARRMLYAGVTGFLDLFNAEDLIFGQREAQRRGELPGADIFASGPCLTATAGHCTEYGVPTRVIDTPEDARQQVSELAPKKPDVVKIVYHHTPGAMPSIDHETLAAAIAVSAEHGLKTVIHVGSWQDARDAVLAGASAITHVPGGGAIPDDLVAAMRERGTVAIPTLTVHTELRRFLEKPTLLDEPLLAVLTTERIRGAYRDEEKTKGLLERIERHRAYRKVAPAESVRKMAAAGIVILTGTDAGNLGTVQGYSVHRELELLVEAGLDPWQALAASTTRAGEFLGRSYGFAEGAEASLVVLDASPIDDIRNSRKIHRVIHHGELIDREVLLAQPPPSPGG